MLKLNVVSDRARDRLKLLNRTLGFDEEIGLRVLLLTSKSEDEIFAYWTGEVERIVKNGSTPEVAAFVICQTIAQVMGWAEPVKLGPPKGVSTAELTDMYQRDVQEYNRWMKKLGRVAQITQA